MSKSLVLLSVFSSGDALRRTSQRQTSSIQPSERYKKMLLPMVAGCEVGSAFTNGFTCAKSPFQPFTVTENVVTNASMDYSYYRLKPSSIKDNLDEFTRTTGDITRNQGGITFGTLHSAMSQQLQEGGLSVHSVAWFVGNSILTKYDSAPIRDLKLTNEARALLVENPTKFVKTYGTEFVDSVGYGCDFLGSAIVNPKSSEARDVPLEMFGDDTDSPENSPFQNAWQGFWFERMVDGAKNDVEMKLSAHAVGPFTGAEVDTSSVERLNDAAKRHAKECASSPAANTITIKSLSSVKDVGNAMTERYRKHGDMSIYRTLGLKFHSGEIDDENRKMWQVRASLDQARKWGDSICLEQLDEDVKVHEWTLLTMSRSQDDKIERVVDDGGSISQWLKADGFIQKYYACMA